jgi:spore germination cell wall hydrolase CwlJ-like protein
MGVRRQTMDYVPHRPNSGWRQHVPMAFGGLMLMAAFAFAGHYLGRNAEAHNSVTQASIDLIETPAPTAMQSSKMSLLPAGETFETMSLKAQRNQVVIQDGKGDMLLRESNEAVEPVEAPPKKLVARLAENDGLKIEPAAINLKDDEPAKAVKRLALTPKPPKIEQSFKLSKTEKQKVVAQRRMRLAEENCLARAIYFEARSESELGQMAVAKVVLNRTRMKGFPKTICGVVYQGSNRRNSCQFSFACDGLPDDVKQPAAWATSKRIAKKAMAGEIGMKSMGNAVNYHADYVKPKWSKTMRRLVKIGRHVFYSNG